MVWHAESKRRGDILAAQYAVMSFRNAGSDRQSQFWRSKMKRALAIGLMTLGIAFAGQGPASAAPLGVANTGAPLSHYTDDMLAPAGFDGCWWDVPVIGAGVAFFELLRDEERNRYCPHGYEDVAVDQPVSVKDYEYRKESPKHGRDYLSPK
jgi:hypothetical protein